MRVAHQGRRCFPRRPHLAPKPAEKGLRRAGAVESKLDNDVVRIVGGLKDLVAAHARVLPLAREAVEGSLPGVEVADWVFDLKNVHSFLCPFPLAPHWSTCTHVIKNYEDGVTSENSPSKHSGA